MPNTPIALFAYNRLNHLQRTIQSILQNPEASSTDLIIFSDAAKRPEDETSVSEVRKYIGSISGFKNIKIIVRDENYGLSKSIISGVSETLNEYDSVIVIEDDLIVSPYFLKYMNQALKEYADDEIVISIHGYIYPSSSEFPQTFFIRGADCWGWATWKRGWKHFDSDGSKLLKLINDNNLQDIFDFNGAYPYTQMLKDQISGVVDSWAIRWYASAFVNNFLTLYPGTSLVRNIGIDGTGTNCSTSNLWDSKTTSKNINVVRIPIKEEVSIRKQFGDSLRTLCEPQKKKKSNLSINKLIKKLFKSKKTSKRYGWSGNYSTWEEASAVCSGYSSQKIIDKTINSASLVRDGKAVYERDSYLFDKIEYSWPLLSGLLLAASKNNGNLNVLDFGGSLGSSYFQNKIFLSKLNTVRWCIVEQDAFYEFGKNNFQTEELLFYKTVKECVNQQKPKVLLLCSVLQYIQDPFQMISEFINYGFDYIIIDRTSFINAPNHRITVQNVPPYIYEASYPCWLFNYEKLINLFRVKYNKIAEFAASVNSSFTVDGLRANDLGLILEKKHEL